MEARLTELELRSMHQERSLQELFDTVFTQQQAIDRLERELVQVRQQLNLALPSLVGQPEDDEPPAGAELEPVAGGAEAEPPHPATTTSATMAKTNATTRSLLLMSAPSLRWAVRVLAFELFPAR